MDMPDNYILIVDDDEDDREVLEGALREVSNVILYQTAIDGEQAFKVLDENENLPDVIFLDLNMPRMGGIEFLKRFKTLSKFAYVPVIVYTTSSLQEDIDASFKYGATHFITKQNTYGKLCNALKETFQHILQMSVK